MATSLLLGPLLRHVDRGSATVWVETSAACEVEVRLEAVEPAGEPSGDAPAARFAGRSPTFSVCGHHYALVVVEGLPPGRVLGYQVLLDGGLAWPRAQDARPGPVVRTASAQADPASPPTLDIVFGSCRVDRPHALPWDLDVDADPRGVGVDALVALSRECRLHGRPLPDLLLFLGDQVYADEGMSPSIRERQEQRRGSSQPQGEVADYEEYSWLYRDSWSDPDVRWLLATVPSAMIFDDHEVRDDWNISQAWRRDMAREPWWATRVAGAYASYWVHQHLGNLSPTALGQDEVWLQVRDGAEATELLHRLGARSDAEAGQQQLSRWSYVRDLGGVRLVVVDTRSGRVLTGQEREMLSEREWEFVEQHLTGGVDHLLVAASLPVLLEPAVHDLEAWNAALADRAVWGARAAAWSERLRRTLDLEHWAAFEHSWVRLVGRLAEVAQGRHGAAPASVLVLSGDVHHAYASRLRTRRGADWSPGAPVVQLVSSPIRNAFPRSARRVFRAAHTPAGRLLGRVLRAVAGLPATPLSWRLDYGPEYGNGLGRMLLTGRSAQVGFERAGAEPGGGGRLVNRAWFRLPTR